MVERKNNCFAYRERDGGCSCLRDDASEEYRQIHVCGTKQCPFFKPRNCAKIVARIGDKFKLYTKKQMLTAERYEDAKRIEIKQRRRTKGGY